MELFIDLKQELQLVMKRLPTKCWARCWAWWDILVILPLRRKRQGVGAQIQGQSDLHSQTLSQKKKKPTPPHLKHKDRDAAYNTRGMQVAHSLLIPTLKIKSIQ